MKITKQLIFPKVLFAILAICISLATFLSLPQLVRADDTTIQKIDFDAVNPLKIGGSAVDFSSPGKIVSRVLVFAFPIAGAILFFMIVWGGFEMVSGAADTKSQEAGKQRITAAVVGFILLFAAFWIAQLVQVVFGVQFLG